MAESVTHLEFPSRLAEVPRVQQQIMDAVAAANFEQPSQFAIRLALDEALTNAVRHGNCSDSTKVVKVDFSVTAERFWIAVEDQGCGFQPEGVPDPTDEDNLHVPHGRGVMLMKAYMSQVQYNDKGNRVELVKLRDCSLPKRD